MRYQQSFPTVVPHLRADSLCITHPSATFLSSKLEILVRLACMKHAASVHPEPGSNSPLSEKFMSLVHLSMNRSTSFYFVRFIFFKINRYLSSSAILLSMFYFFRLGNSLHYSAVPFASSSSLPYHSAFNFLSHLSATSSILSPQFFLSTSFLKNLKKFLT